MKNHRFLLLASAAIFFANPALAVDTVKSPRVEIGELEFEQKGKYQHDDAASRDNQKEIEFAVSYGFTENYKAEVEWELEDKPTESFYYRNVLV